ncbi:uncharacterized protein LOC109857777 [Pseudomyrmex gracilis]|uniref:uncharacterized protein LOC109857777 n=1 Tax=Pseudomyrmex gracilis TaxID=219809 RepID=UPI0009953D10|nr:uncharacterized protein LOC109857777 [Pseudomyrmex gracilis]
MIDFSKEQYDEYQEYLTTKKEWPGINVNDVSTVTLNLPMLIMELHRLVPYKKDSYVHFCPHNMPNVRIRKIELVGSVTSIKRIDNMLYLTIEDGTGEIKVSYKLEQYLSELEKWQEINEKYKKQANSVKNEASTSKSNLPTQLPQACPEFSYIPEAHLHNTVEEDRWMDTNKTVKRVIRLFERVYITGYPCFDKRFQKIPDHITTEFAEHSNIIVLALSISWISEESYNKTLGRWLETTIPQRYKHVEKKSCKR